MNFEFGFPESAQVVVVDDEPQNLYVFKDQFGEHFNLKLFEDPSEAISFIRTNRRVLLVVTDQSMPETKGLELALSIKGDLPYLNFIMVTANPESDKNLVYSTLKHNIFYDFLQKPLDFEVRHKELLYLFRQALADSFTKLKTLNYTFASESFSVTPITRQEHEQIESLIRANFVRGLKIEAHFTTVQIFKSFQNVFAQVATLEKFDTGTWCLTVKTEKQIDPLITSGNGQRLILGREFVDVFNALLNSKDFVEEKKTLVAANE